MVEPDTVRRLTDRLRGQQLTMVSFTPYLVRLVFLDTTLTVEAHWTLTQGSHVIDQGVPMEERESFGLWKITGRFVESAEVHTVEFSNITISLSGEYQFTAYGDGDGYEDWDIGSNSPSEGYIGLLCEGQI